MNIDTIAKVVPFLESYPVWVKIVSFCYVLCVMTGGLLMLGLLLFVPKHQPAESKQITAQTEKSEDKKDPQFTSGPHSPIIANNANAQVALGTGITQVQGTATGDGSIGLNQGIVHRYIVLDQASLPPEVKEAIIKEYISKLPSFEERYSSKLKDEFNQGYIVLGGDNDRWVAPRDLPFREAGLEIDWSSASVKVISKAELTNYVPQTSTLFRSDADSFVVFTHPNFRTAGGSSSRDSRSILINRSGESFNIFSNPLITLKGRIFESNQNGAILVIGGHRIEDPRRISPEDKKKYFHALRGTEKVKVQYQRRIPEVVALATDLLAVLKDAGHQVEDEGMDLIYPMHGASQTGLSIVANPHSQPVGFQPFLHALANTGIRFRLIASEFVTPNQLEIFVGTKE